MRLQVAGFAASFCLITSIGALGASTDFSDLTAYQEFVAGQSIDSLGLSFIVERYIVGNESVIVSGESENDLFLGLRGFAIDFVLPSTAEQISLLYSDGAGSRIVINGVEPTFPGDLIGDFFSRLDGTTVDGVLITTDMVIQSRRTLGNREFIVAEEGILTLRGPINSFNIGGLELSIDDVSVRVPEPASWMLLGIASLLVGGRRISRIAR